MSKYSTKLLFSFLRTVSLLACTIYFCCESVYASQNDHIPVDLPVFKKPSNPNSAALSSVAIEVANFLGIENDLKRLQIMRKQIAALGSKPNLELRQDLSELKIDLIAAIEQARLDVDFVSAEIEDEEARYQELYQACVDEQNKRILRANVNAFRTNGVLWAIAEALDIPTYKHPKYSISSGTIGILAGVTPSLFSLWAVREPKQHYSYSSYPNTLCKIFDYPISPRIEYPDSVWAFMNAKPLGEPIKSRKELLVDHWLKDKNVRSFNKKDDKQAIDLLTGTKQHLITIDILSDQLLMLRETKAIVIQLNRLLMELMMAVRGQKELN